MHFSQTIIVALILDTVLLPTQVVDPIILWGLSHQPLEINRFAGLLAVAVCSVLKLRQRSLGLPQQLRPGLNGMNDASGLLLVLTVAVVGVFHTIAPDRWVPISLLARQRG
jgi:hypothetical protein